MNNVAHVASFIPSPDQAVWHLGPLPIRGYALCLIAGMFAAVWIGEKRFQARGGASGVISDIAIWAIPFGIVGGRLYHVLTDPQLYFGEGRNPIDAVKIWNGGLGIWGAIALGGVGAYIACRRNKVNFLMVADALAPALLVAQGIGRLGNYVNQELFGKPTTLPWGLEIDPQFRPEGYEQFATFHPTFLYEMLWNFAAAAVIIWIDRRWRLSHGRVFALYVMFYTAGRGWIEAMRIDSVNHIGPFRLNVWTSIIVFLGGLLFFLWARRKALREQRAGAVTASDSSTDGPSTDGPSTDGPSTDGPSTDGSSTDGSSTDGSGTEPAPDER